jgi:ubiquinone/menaquinone biosynthesis C-methylase UbiE
MGTILRTWSYRYQWLYDGISRVAGLAVGGEYRFRRLALGGLKIDPHAKILDLCCGSGQVTGVLLEYSDDVTGLDVSPLSLSRSRRNVPLAKYVESLAEEMLREVGFKIDSQPSLHAGGSLQVIQAYK